MPRPFLLISAFASNVVHPIYPTHHIETVPFTQAASKSNLDSCEQYKTCSRANNGTETLAMYGTIVLPPPRRPRSIKFQLH
jgi:hypothetical protein